MRKRGIGTIVKVGLLVVLTLGVMLAVVVGWAVWQVRGTPDYWRTIDASDPQIEAAAADFEQQFHAALTQAGDSDEPWQLEVETVDVNQWLATRLPQWESNDARVEIPDWIEQPMVVTRPNEIILAAQLNIANVQKVVSFGYRPAHEPDGVVALELRRMRVGNLWLPAAEGMSKLLAEAGQLSPEKRAKRSQLGISRENRVWAILRITSVTGRS